MGAPPAGNGQRTSELFMIFTQTNVAARLVSPAGAKCAQLAPESSLWDMPESILVQTGRDRAMMTECDGFARVEALFKGRHFDGQIIILCVSW
jgi:hypothetical protein